jgi:signal transduction histidine kinase
MKNKPRVLFVGRDASDAALLDVVFERDAPDCEVVHVGDPITFGREIERADFDLVVCEDGLEWIGGPGVLVEVRARRPSATVVVLTTRGDAPVEADLRRREVVLPKTSASFLELPALLRAALERAAIEASVTRLEPRIRGLLEKSRVGVFRCTLNGRLLDADETFLSILGAASVEQARAMDLGELTPQLPRGFTETGKVYKREEKLQTATGEPLWAAVTEIVNLDEQGMPVLDGLLEDISERKGMESDLSVEASKLARSNEDLRMFASLAAHELKEPLRTIEQSTKVLLEDGQEQRSDDAKQSADLIVGGVKRLQSMIEGLLTLARFGGGSEWVEACDCNELMDEVLDGLKVPIDESGAEVVVKALPTVHADPLQLRLVFRNLVANAVKYSGDAPPRIEVSARQDEEEWVFSVQDEGVGIAPESSERIFDQFARGDEGSGAGLGLAICRQVVERHGGRIWVDSEKGRGATFFFTIPLSSGIRGSDRRDDDGGGPPQKGTPTDARREAG